jgi:hypothetical protein
LNLFKKESENLANRLIEGQVLNAQYAEESYQLKRENCTFKKQIEDKNNPNIDQTISINSNQNPPDFYVLYKELETLHETVNKLTAVGLDFSSIISSNISIGKSSFTINPT